MKSGLACAGWGGTAEAQQSLAQTSAIRWWHGAVVVGGVLGLSSWDWARTIVVGR
jgi:hypothetical protein